MKFYNSIIILLLCFIGLNLVESSPCSSDSDCNGNGKCNTTSTICACNTGYVTYNNENCNYLQKEKITAFLLSFLVGTFGADWFYLANGRANYIVAGCFKLITGVFFIIGSCFLCCTTLCSLFDRSKLQAFGLVFSVIIGVLMALCSLTNAIWYTVDWIRILCNAFPDGNGVALKNW